MLKEISPYKGKRKDMAKDSIWRRILNIFRAEGHAHLKSAKREAKQLSAQRATVDTAVNQAEASIILTVENLRSAELKQNENEDKLLTLQIQSQGLAEELKQAHNKCKTEADLAQLAEKEGILREVVTAQVNLELTVANGAKAIKAQKQTIAKLRQNLNELKTQKDAFTTRILELDARKTAVDALAITRESLTAVNSSKDGSLTSMEADIKKKEAIEAAYVEMSENSVERQLALLDIPTSLPILGRG